MDIFPDITDALCHAIQKRIRLFRRTAIRLNLIKVRKAFIILGFITPDKASCIHLLTAD